MALSETLEAGLRYLGRERPMPAGLGLPTPVPPRGEGAPPIIEHEDEAEDRAEPSSEAEDDRRWSRMTLQVSCRERKCSRVSQPPPTRIITCFSFRSCEDGRRDGTSE